MLWTILLLTGLVTGTPVRPDTASASAVAVLDFDNHSGDPR